MVSVGPNSHNKWNTNLESKLSTTISGVNTNIDRNIIIERKLNTIEQTMVRYPIYNSGNQ